MFPRLQNLPWSLANRTFSKESPGDQQLGKEGERRGMRYKKKSSFSAVSETPTIPTGSLSTGVILQKCPKLSQKRYFCTLYCFFHFLPMYSSSTPICLFPSLHEETRIVSLHCRELFSCYLHLAMLFCA